MAAAPAAPVPYAYPYPYYGWHPWGFGFFLAPFFVFVIFVTLIRAAFWRSRWSYYGRCGHAFDEWHRRAHERESMEDRGDDSDRR